MKKQGMMAFLSAVKPGKIKYSNSLYQKVEEGKKHDSLGMLQIVSIYSDFFVFLVSLFLNVGFIIYLWMLRHISGYSALL
jgi:hypothetical protein